MDCDRDEATFYSFRALVAGNALTILTEVDRICAKLGFTRAEYMEYADEPDVITYMHAREAYERIVKEESKPDDRSSSVGPSRANAHLAHPSGIHCGNPAV